jgi:uncharacterized protein YndB with AHSA1/START domain
MTGAGAPSGDLVVRRLLSAPRERVFAAWLDPVSLAQWMCPGGVTSATVQVDPRVGGKFRIVMQHPGGAEEHWGEYLVIEPPERLSFSWISAKTDLETTVVSVELVARGAGTELILSHRRLPAAQVRDHRDGWTDIIRKLGEELGRGPHRG